MPEPIEYEEERVERELLVPARPAEVWELITGPGWLADEVSFELFPSGDARFVTDGTVKEGWIEEVISPEDTSGWSARLTFWWAEGDEAATRVELTLEPEENGQTRLRVVEARPLDALDVVGIPLPGMGGSNSGPVMLSLA
jgi:uncharacterized protein YndB with AHSA1/START domain